MTVTKQGLGSQSGVTLIEMLLVATLLALMVTISFPSVTAGVDSLRLASASDSIVSFLNAGLNRAERRQHVVEVTIAKLENAISLRSTEPGFLRRLELPDGITIVQVVPPLPLDPNLPRRFLLYPGGTVPRFGVEIVNRRGARRIVRVDPITGVPLIERPEPR